MTLSPPYHPFANCSELYAACASTDAHEQRTAYETLWRYLFGVASYMLREKVGGEALAQDCAQIALIRVHERRSQCREPAAFCVWARRIVSHAVIDTLRREKKLTPLDDQESTQHTPKQMQTPAPTDQVLSDITLSELDALLKKSPISERSYRVVAGRYLHDVPDEQLAQQESTLAGREVLPSHIQVTRSKDLARLRNWDRLARYFDRDGSRSSGDRT